MPLKKAAPRKKGPVARKKAINKAVGDNIDEMFHEPGKKMDTINKKYGKKSKKAQAIRIAAAERAARAKTGGRTRNKGRG